MSTIPFPTVDASALTVLECRTGILTKRFLADGTKVDFTGGYLFRVHELRADTWTSLVRALATLVALPPTCVIRGAPVDDCPRADDSDQWVYRRLHDRPGEPANFVSVPRRWVVYDFDDTIAPFNAASPEASVRAWHATLPAELRGARAAFFLSSSAHLSPTVRGKLVTWYDRDISEALARAYAVHYGADPSVAGAIQPNYFAAPLFEGCADPLAEWRAPILFDGVDATPPPRVALRATRNRPSPVRLAALPPGDAGIVAALGRHEDMVGHRFTLCGKLGGIMRKLLYPSEVCDAVVREWLTTGDTSVDVDRGVRWALGAWTQPATTVSGAGGLADVVGRAHARVILDACLRARRPRPLTGKGGAA
jgi:hypothetical protein